MSTTVTTKGQVTIPKAIRDHLGLEPGSEVEFVIGKEGDYVLRRADGKRPPSKFAKLRGSAGKGMSTDELMALLRGED
jgi:AbrB family looped-hinge helix DNA binding protein